VTVTAGSTAIRSWTVKWTFTNGETIQQMWNAGYSANGAQITASNVSYNGALAARATATFGFNGAGSVKPVSATCISS